MIGGWISAALNLGSNVLGYFNKKIDAKVETHRIDGDVEIAGAQALASVAQARAGSLWDGIGRAIIMWPVGLWIASIFLYCILKPYFPDLLKPVLSIPKNIEYIPYAVVGYHFIRLFK